MPRFRSLLALSCLLLVACSGESETQAPADPPASLTVSVAPPAQQALPQRITASGSVAAWEEMSLGVELSGQRVAEVLVEVGDTVTKGQPLLRLDTRSLEMEQRQAEAALAQAQANLTVAAANARRGERLKKEQLVAASEADQLIAGELTAQAQRNTAQAQLENARLRLGFATLRAPDDGVISARSVQPGQVVVTAAEMLRLIRKGRLEWRAELPEAELIRVSPGAAVELRSPDGAAVRGTVRAVSPSLDAQSRTGTVYADLPEPGALRAGMYASGDIVLGERTARTVPESAIVERDGHRYLFVLGDQDVVSQRRVQTGARSNGVVEIRDGLQGDEQVVVQGAGFLSDGDRVRVVPADAAG
ncbi:efflux RND transporter periplasmic adaptor subunit [Arenimonas terrae]|uniref:Efflux RND transporter periplasmic adaptor subunit n=1 Tax=Arenimonas terrae TaxID=2546226 RepID=A0A5C4RNL8_9GAMM|nr:efflux RND transporter periplasmic adaptor subunit [Arenimonas terrae]TNJ32846.1 efflux RND transporter periplasmic adaptor subunit [Arenimonas terrae]